MAKQDKLMKAFEAFVNNDLESATDHYRQFFIESAQEINSQLEEGFGGDMEEDMYDEVGVDMEDDIEEDDDEFDEFEAEGEDEFEAEDDVEGEGSEPPSAEEWEKFEDAFEELEALFNDAQGGEMDDLVEESFDYGKVKQPSMQETDADPSAKSTVASPQMTGPTGAKATDGWTKDGTVKGSNVKGEYPDSETPKVEDHSNVMKSGKQAYKKTKTPSMKETEADQKQSTIKPYKK